MANLGFNLSSSQVSYTRDPYFVVGNATYSMVSTNGITWTTSTASPQGLAAQMLSYGNGTYVSSGHQNGTSNLAYSTDGITWTKIFAPFTNASSLTYGAGLFLLTTANSGTSIATSTNGITWTTKTIPTGIWYGSAYGNGLYAVSSGGVSVITSTDTTTWTLRTAQSLTGTLYMTYGNLFVSVNNTSGLSTVAGSSTDGITWNLRTLPSSQVWLLPVYGNGIFLTTTANGPSAYSTDGITWTATTLPTGYSSWSNPAFSEGYFFVVGSTRTAISTNAVNWTLGTVPYSTNSAVVGSYLNESPVSISNSEFSQINSTTSNIQTQLNTIPANNQTFYIGTQAIAANQATGTVTALPGVTSVNGTTIPASSTLTSTDSQTLTNTNLQNVTDAVLTGSFNLQQNLIGQIQQPISATTYTVQPIDKFLVFNGTAACTVTLPSASTYPNREIVMKQIAAFAVNSASSNVQPLTSTTAGTAILSGAGKFATIVSNGSAWQIIKSN